MTSLHHRDDDDDDAFFSNNYFYCLYFVKFNLYLNRYFIYFLSLGDNFTKVIFENHIENFLLMISKYFFKIIFYQMINLNKDENRFKELLPFNCKQSLK